MIDIDYLLSFNQKAKWTLLGLYATQTEQLWLGSEYLGIRPTAG